MHSVTPAFCGLLLILCIAILMVKKENMVVPLIIAMCFLPADISLKIATLDFYAVRIVALVGLMKIYIIGDYGRIKSNTIDKYFFLYVISGSIIYIIASQNTFGALVYKSGRFVDSVILYIVLRNSIYSKESLRLIIKTFSICIIFLLPFTIFEFFSSHNLFAILGRSAISDRNGEIRAAATFSHAILYGSFAAALLPILWAEYKIDKSKIVLLSVLCCLFFVYACSSSGPIVVLAATICFLIFFSWKRYSALGVKVMVMLAIFIHFARESPIWHFLYVRIAVKGSSTGYHRYLLMEAAVKEFKNWWLLGYGDVGPQWHAKYWPHTHAKFTDVTNDYLAQGVRGGFLTLLLYLILCYKILKTLGVFSINQKNVEDQWLWWGFTGMMVAHCITFLSVAYFGQITMLLYLTIAVAAFTYDESCNTIE